MGVPLKPSGTNMLVFCLDIPCLSSLCFPKVPLQPLTANWMGFFFIWTCLLCPSFACSQALGIQSFGLYPSKYLFSLSSNYLSWSRAPGWSSISFLWSWQSPNYYYFFYPAFIQVLIVSDSPCKWICTSIRSLSCFWTPFNWTAFGHLKYLWITTFSMDDNYIFFSF